MEFTKLSVDEMTSRMCASIKLDRVYQPARTMHTIMSTLEYEAKSATSLKDVLRLISGSMESSTLALDEMGAAVSNFQNQLTLQEGTE